MRLCELQVRGCRRHGSTRTVGYRTGPFLVSLRSDYGQLFETLIDLYPDAEVADTEEVYDFHVAVRRPRRFRRWWRPQVEFFIERENPFEPYPLDHAFPMLEWGLNWCIAMRAHQFLMLHAGAVERGGAGLVLPAVPGSGKSTLSAALALSGWRLLSDEFGLYEPAAHEIAPLPRAVPLKNESIEVIRAFAPEAHLGPLFPKTRKGDVAHLRPPGDSLRRQREPATPRWIVFPRFERGQHPTVVRPLPKSLAFTRLAKNSFNYQVLGRRGFDALVTLIRACDCYSMTFGDLNGALDRLDALCEG